MATKLRDSNRQSSAHVPVTELALTSGPAHEGRIDTRVTKLEADVCCIRRDLCVVQSDAHDIKRSIAGIDCTLVDLAGKLESLDAKVDAKAESLDKKFDARINSLEAKVEAKFDSLEAKFEARFASMDSKFDSKIDNLEIKLNGKIDRVIESMEQFPTKLQLARWAAGFISAFLVVAIAIIALLLRANGHPLAAEVVETAIGK
jgi:chromosome segregation ATPase